MAAGALIFVALDHVHFGRGFSLGVIAGPCGRGGCNYLAPALGGLLPLAGVMLTR